MRMTIDRMTISNFKGIRELSIDFGDVTRISGMNGTGKTTIPDAFSWVLWNKDSRGNAPGSYEFREKPLDENGDEIHTLDLYGYTAVSVLGKAHIGQLCQFIEDLISRIPQVIGMLNTAALNGTDLIVQR